MTVSDIAILNQKFQLLENKKKAAQMAAYLKNKFVLYGLTAAQRRNALKEFVGEVGYPSRADLQEVVWALWEMPQREFHHTAIDIMQKMQKQLLPEDLPLLQKLIVTHSWWDSVDGLAAWIAGALFKKYPDLIPNATLAWMESGNFWLQRSCLLFQLKYKEDTDLILLESFIEQLKDEKEFFIKKAIGWVLREYSKTDPQWVSSFLKRHQLQPLSVREASKYL